MWFPSNLEFNLGCHTCWLSCFTLVCLWCGRTVGVPSQITKFSRMGRLPHFLSYGAPPACGASRRAWSSAINIVTLPGSLAVFSWEESFKIAQNTTFEAKDGNRPFGRWRHFTTTTRILQDFFLLQIRPFFYINLAEITEFNKRKGKTKRILIIVVKWRHQANGPFIIGKVLIQAII